MQARCQRKNRPATHSMGRAARRLVTPALAKHGEVLHVRRSNVRPLRCAARVLADGLSAGSVCGTERAGFGWRQRTGQGDGLAVRPARRTCGDLRPQGRQARGRRSRHARRRSEDRDDPLQHSQSGGGRRAVFDFCRARRTARYPGEQCGRTISASRDRFLSERLERGDRNQSFRHLVDDADGGERLARCQQARRDRQHHCGRRPRHAGCRSHLRARAQALPA